MVTSNVGSAMLGPGSSEGMLAGVLMGILTEAQTLPNVSMTLMFLPRSCIDQKTRQENYICFLSTFYQGQRNI